jgi:hypothetical protein
LEQSLDAVLTRAFRRPPEAEERQRLLAVANAELEETGFDSALKEGLTAMLLAPQVLYRPEFGVAGSADAPVALTGYEVATRLSFLLWRQSPDDALLTAAGDGELDTAAGIATQAERMLADDRAKNAFENFISQWLKLDKVDQLSLTGEGYPEVTQDLRDSLRTSVQRSVSWALWEQHSLDALFSSEEVFMDQRLGELLGETVSGDELTLTPAANRLGILTHPAILSLTSHGGTHSPILRGIKVLQSFLCITIPAPPPGVNAAVAQPPAGETFTTRQHVEETHSGKTACRSCHNLIDGVGFAFENYDALGRYRTQENGIDVDATGVVPLRSGDVEIDNALELAAALRDSPDVRQCVTQHLFRFAYGQSPKTEPSVCEVAALAGEWEATEGDPTKLLEALVTGDAFRYLPAAPSSN